jgi:hypothetical protein
MAERKPQVPSPPRRQSGPKQRSASRPRKPRIALVAAGTAALAAAGLAAVFLRGGEGSGDPTRALAAAGCTLRTFPEQPARHVSDYDAEVQYNSFPPTSGPHHQRPVIWGAYSESVFTVQGPHNLEHGGVVIYYGADVDAETRSRVHAFYVKSPNGVVLAPLPELGRRIALTAWTKLATCERFDDEAFAAFRNAYRGRVGPEARSHPVSVLRPGT